MRFKAVSVLSAAFVIAGSAGLEGQIIGGPVVQLPSRFSIGGDVVMSQPKSEFADNVGRGYGFDVNGLFRVDRRGYFSIRGDIGTVQYGRERKDVSFFGITGRVDLELETTNNIWWFALGPQLMIPDGPFRPYVNAAFAYTDFSTTSTLTDPYGQFNPISNRNAHDGSYAGIFGTGFLLPMGKSFSLNFGGRYYYGGRAEYLVKGDITDNPDGTITINPRNSKTDMVVWQLGATLVLPQPTTAF